MTQKLSQKEIYNKYAKEHLKHQDLGLLFLDIRDILFELTSNYARDSFLGTEKGNLILDIGCGEGRGIVFVSQSGAEVVGCDISEDALRVTKLRLRSRDSERRCFLVVCDAENLPFKDEAFDKLNAQEVLEHVPMDRKAVGEIYRVLKKGGRGWISVPNENTAWTLEGISRKLHGYSINDTCEGHIKNYTVDGLIKLVEDYEFRVVIVKFYYFILMPLIIDFIVKLSSFVKRISSLLVRPTAFPKSREFCNFLPKQTGSLNKLVASSFICFCSLFGVMRQIDDILFCFRKKSNSRHIGVLVLK